MASTSMEKGKQVEQNSPSSTEAESGVQDARLDDELCKIYLDEASAVDTRRIDSWTKIVDVILVYIAFFSGVLTAFIIESTKSFRPDTGEVTNRILIAIYNQTMNATAPIDLEKYLRLDNGAHKSALYKNAILYTSLAFCIVVSFLATLLKLWIIQHERDMNPSGPLYIRLRKRQEAYNGSIVWRLEGCIASLPIMSFIALILFGLFILTSIHETQPAAIGSAISIIFKAGVAYVVLASCAGAFISDAPFRSSLSDFIKVIFPNFNILKLKRRLSDHLRTVWIILTSVIVVGAAAYLTLKYNTFYINLMYYPVMGMFALTKKGQEKDIQQRLYSLPGWVFFPSVLIFLLYNVSLLFINFRHTSLFFSFISFASVLLGVLTYSLIKMSETKPATTIVEAIAWMIESTSSQDPTRFQKAIEIAGNSRNLRALLLERLLPLVESLITLEDEAQNIKLQQEAYIECLENLIDIDPSEGSFWRNVAPIPSKTLSMELKKLQNLSCPLMMDNPRTTDCKHGQEKCPSNRVKALAGRALERWNNGQELDVWRFC